MALYAKIDVALTRDHKMIAAGPLPRLLYLQSVLYCRENLTDGIVHELLLPLVAVDISTPRRHMDKLVAVGAMVRIEDGWRIPDQVWKRWNPTAEEVQAKRDEEARRKQSYRDRMRTPDDVPTGQKVARGTRDRQPEPEPEPEPEQYQSSSTEELTNRPNPQPSTKTDDDETVNQALWLHAQWLAETNAQPEKRRRYVEKVMANSDDHRQGIAELARQKPDSPAAQLAYAYRTGGWPQQRHPSGHDTRCECEGTGWVVADVDDQGGHVKRCTSEPATATIHQLHATP